MKAKITIGRRKASLRIDGREAAALYFVRGWWRERVGPSVYGIGVMSCSERWALARDLCAMARQPHDRALAAIDAAEEEAFR